MVFNQNKKVMDIFMKRLLPTCFLPLAVTFTLYTGAPVIFEKPDTVTVHSTGINNKVVIDSLQLTESINESILSPVKGEIIQTGENNRVEINTGGEAPNNKLSAAKSRKAGKQITNKQQITNSRNRKTSNEKPATSNQLERSVYPGGRNPDISSGEPATSNKQPATIKVTQTGKNNSVKINSR